MSNKKDKIELTRFTVELQRWGDKKGEYTCSASFQTENMNFTVDIDNDLGNALTAICRGKISEHTQVALEALQIINNKGT